jgi:Lon protease-like protein
MPPYPLPLFPLNVVLFPGTPLPLHIFEPRYRQMVSDCLIGDRRFGIVQPGTGAERPDRGAVGCVAEIRANEQLPDGRSHIVVVGGARFVVQRMLDDPAPYFVGLVEEFLEQGGTSPTPAVLNEVRTLFARYYELYRMLHDADPEDPDLPDEAVSLSFTISAALECDLPLKGRLLATRATRERFELLLRLIPALSTELESALRVHRRAYQNGKGSRHSVLPTES